MSLARVFSPQSYAEWLRLQDQQEVLQFELSRQTQTLIASNEQLAATGLKVVSESADKVIIALSDERDRLSSVITDLDWTFRWGFTEVLARLEHLNTSLEKLVEIVANPSTTWAYEQFRISGDAFDHGHYLDALDYAERAINGYGGNAGFRLDHRFHFLLGLIRLGNHNPKSLLVVDLEKAERAFLDAGEYAKKNAEKGRSYLAAGWAALCQRKYTQAGSTTGRALQYDPDLAEAHFQMGKICAALGRPIDALTSLDEAMRRDINYLFKAASDEDYCLHEPELREFIGNKSEAERKRASGTLARAEDLLKRLNSITLATHAKSAANVSYEKANAECNTKSLRGYVNANHLLAQFEVEFAEAVSQMSAQCAARRSDLINKAQSEKNIAEDKAKSAIDDRRTHIATKEDNIKTFIIIGTFLVSFLVSLLALYDHWTHYQGHPIPRFTTTLFLAVALAVMIAILTIGGWLVGTIVSKICRSTWSSPESAAKPFAKEIKGIENSADNELRTVDRLQQEINTTKVMLERKT